MVLRKGGGLTYLHLEKELGLPAPHEEVMAGVLTALSENRAPSSPGGVARSSLPSMSPLSLPSLIKVSNLSNTGM